MFEPLRITAHLRSAIVTDGYLPIDAILYYEAMRRTYGGEVISSRGGETYVEPVRLPIERIELAGRHWMYAASFAQWYHSADGSDHWNKRFDAGLSELVDFDGRRGKVIVEQGRYKAYHMPVFYRTALAASWYVVGDREALSELVGEITHVGKKSSQGFGRLNCWQVDPWPQDWSLYGEQGQLMRAIPQAGGVLYGIRPGYWQRSHQVPCKLP